MKNVVRVVILSRDRPEYLKEAIDSVLGQKQESVDIRLLVSDNSVGDEVNDMINAVYFENEFDYIRRSPPLTSLDHTRRVISECEEDYIVMFHDDDVMHPNYAETMFPFLQKKGVAAVGCNAFIFKNETKESLYAKSHRFESPKEFTDKREFLEQYIPDNYGVAVFSGNMYNTACLRKINLNNVHRKNGGSDVISSYSLLEHGSIIWIPDYLVYYRLHDSNDGNNLYTADHIQILNCMSKNGIDKHTVAASMRFNYLFQWFVNQDVRNIFSWRNWIVFKYLFFKSFYLMGKPNLWRSLLNNRYVKNKILGRL